jgi:hypothetical protein
MGEYRFKEIWKCPPEESRRGCRAIRGATIEIVSDRPPLVLALRQAALVVMHLRQIAVAPFHG